jgi:hypothetical protein
MLGYALAILLCIPAYRGITREPEQRPEAPQTINRPLPLDGLAQARIIEFPTPKRAANRGRQHVRLSAGDKIVGLAFFLPDRSKLGWHYQAELFNNDGASVTGSVGLRSQDGLGNFLVAVRAELLEDGAYELRVRETGPGTRPIVEHRFPFVIQR